MSMWVGCVGKRMERKKKEVEGGRGKHKKVMRECAGAGAREGGSERILCVCVCYLRSLFLSLLPSSLSLSGRTWDYTNNLIRRIILYPYSHSNLHNGIDVT